MKNIIYEVVSNIHAIYKFNTDKQVTKFNKIRSQAES